MLKPEANSKSPVTVLFLITVLIISTLVMVSNYFFRPGLESDIKNRIISALYSHAIFNAVIDVNGRDVVLKGITPNPVEAKKIENDIKNIKGVNQLYSKLVIESEVDNIYQIQNDQKSSN